MGGSTLVRGTAAAGGAVWSKNNVTPARLRRAERHASASQPYLGCSMYMCGAPSVTVPNPPKSVTAGHVHIWLSVR